MDSEGYRRKYKYYIRILRLKIVSFSCLRCGESFLPKNFEKHCFKTHGLNPKYVCVWCWGKTSWESRKKNENSLHLLECFRKFIRPYEISISLAKKAAAKANSTIKTTSTPKLVPSSNELLCPGHCFFDHESDYIRELPEALNLFQILSVDPPGLPYSDQSVNLAASYVLKYRETRDTHDWSHVMVKAVAFESFRNALDENCGLLPFSCWCDGGPNLETRHRQHRHMILVTFPKGHFESAILPRVQTNDRPRKNFKCKLHLTIESSLHLIHTLGYLSQRQSNCEFFPKKKGIPKDRHFYIFTTLPENYKLPLAVLLKSGLRDLMYCDLFQNVSIEKVAEKPMDRVDDKWVQKIEDFYKLHRDLVLSVDRRFSPTERKTPYYIYLLKDRELYFEICPENESLSEEEWIAKQIRGGNCFYQTVEKQTWTPRPRDQYILNMIMPREYRIRELEIENSLLKRKVEDIEGENKRLKLEYEPQKHTCTNTDS